jgi:two-component system, response regulator PdtaR
MPVILTVEDEVLVREYLEQILNDTGFTVISTSNADDAIEALESRDDIQFIITDVNMPGSMDGLKLAEAVRDRWPPIKVIITTGRAPPTEGQAPTDSVFLPKPYTSEAVAAALDCLR